MSQLKSGGRGRYLFVGLLTATPLLATWTILDFLFSHLARIGRPVVTALSGAIRVRDPEFEDLLIAALA